VFEAEPVTGAGGCWGSFRCRATFGCRWRRVGGCGWFDRRWVVLDGGVNAGDPATVDEFGHRARGLGSGGYGLPSVGSGVPGEDVMWRRRGSRRTSVPPLSAGRGRGLSPWAHPHSRIRSSHLAARGKACSSLPRTHRGAV